MEVMFPYLTIVAGSSGVSFGRSPSFQGTSCTCTKTEISFTFIVRPMAEYLSLHALLDELNPALHNYFPWTGERKIEETRAFVVYLCVST